MVTDYHIYESDMHIAKLYNKVIWRCNANRNEHAGEQNMQATARTTICNKKGGGK